MIIINDKAKCCGCYACYNICPQNCVSMQLDEEGFWYPAVDVSKCTNCGLCEKVCPTISRTTVANQPLAYACINKDESVRQESSSGGFFSAIAESVIDNGGVVFGAAFDDDFCLHHCWTDSSADLKKFRGSKYVQSNIGDTYRQAQAFLQQGRQVLFSGTPCQIAGLINYLGKSYEELICLDIICHGVPSPKVFARYRAELERRNGGKVRSISFRRKDCGWKLFSIAMSFDNDTEYKSVFRKDFYMKGFLQNLYLRPSCYQCNFRTISRQSDITVADFWGIENILPDLDDDKGVSLVLLHSERGKAVFSSLASKLKSVKVDVNKAILYNPSAVKSAPYHHNRDVFFKELPEVQDVSQLIAKYRK